MKINGVAITSERDILDVLAEVESEQEFAVLEQSKTAFMQTSESTLEYRYRCKLYRTTEGRLTQDRIREAFLSYYRGDGKYITDFSWDAVDIPLGLLENIKRLFRR